jgi:PAS domain S-box-containing protein
MSALQILHLEDNDADAELVQEQLRRGGVEAEIVRVRGEREFSEEIARGELDIILADCHCSQFNGLKALSLAREKRAEVPFVFVCKALDHHHAMESLSAGASDFVLKQHLPQLVPAVRRALDASQTRTELRIARENLRTQAELLDLANDSIILCDADGTIRYWNRGSERTYGWSKEEAVGQNVDTLLQTHFVDGVSDIATTLRTQSHWEGELQQVRRDGTPIHVMSHWTLKSNTPDSSRLQINTDITAQKHAEGALRRSEERYRRFVDEDLTANLIIRPDGTILTCNPAFVRMFGFNSTEHALASNFLSLLRNRKDGAELFVEARQNRAVERNELEMRHLGGEAVYVAARLVGSFDQDGELHELQAYLFNDTKRKRLEQQLVQAQKMEGLGTLAGGIAHDFNNILAIILGYAGQIESRMAQPEQIAHAVKVIREAVERGAALVQQLLTSARQAEAHFSPVDVNALLTELERMLQATFPKMITFELRLQQNLPPIKADRSQIHQVLLNLCVNARDAMPLGGTICLETSLVSREAVAEHFTGADAKQYGCMRVRDTGCGMTPEVKAHIFEPFFTTKERAKGTGLGLSVVYGVVNNHGGFVHVETAPAAGTTFNIYLPVRHTAQTSLSDASPAGPHAREAQTILLVEDEEMLRDLGVQILEGEGYRVIAAKDGLEAVELFALHRDSIGLVVCDLGLPRLGGRDAFMKMKEIKPSVRAIVASGYLEPSVRSEILRAGVIDTIQKPYDFREMLEKIRSVIGKAQSEDDHPQLF